MQKEALCDEKDCTGCGACFAACPVQCIRMTPDDYGFYRPKINHDMCIHCNKCASVCPHNHILQEQSVQSVWAAWNKNQEEHAICASGGIASALYTCALNNDFVVSGAEFTQKLQLKHTLKSGTESTEKYKSSKYVQSLCFDVFQDIKHHLTNGRKVLFVGTPCQVAGLKSFIGNNDRLFTVDLICHGVPSPKFLSEHVEGLAHSKDSDILVSFRDRDGWQFKVFENGTAVYSQTAKRDLYYLAFLNALCYRPCCYACQYANLSRVGDLTLGDFWGLGKKEPFSNPVEKVSLVLINNSRGEQLWENISGLVCREKRQLEEAVIDNAQLLHPSVPHANRNKFLEEYEKFGFEEASRRSLKSDLRMNTIAELKQKIAYKARHWF